MSSGSTARAYREHDMSVQPRHTYATSRPPLVYSKSHGSHLLRHPKSVITFEFYHAMSEPAPAQVLPQSPQRRGNRPSSPKPSVRHQVGTRKLGGRPAPPPTSSTPPLGHYQSSGYFTITAYLPFDGGKRLKLQCTPGMTVQQVIETEIPDISRTGYQVFHFPSRALLNPEKDAGVLQDQEICIEPMRLHSPDAVDDKRLMIVRELLRTEDNYLENLRNIFDVYMEPLRKWSLPQSDMNIMFRSLSRLCDLLMNFFSELEIAVQYWDTTRTVIGGLFKQYPSFWDLYDEYSLNYPKAIKLLKEKRSDESFASFLEMKRGAAMHTLESLMLLPVQRIYDYHRLLVQLFSITSKDHPDYDDLRHTVARVQHMVQAREHQLTQSENESKLEQVQMRFPNDNLFLTESLAFMEALTRRSPAGGRGHQKKNSLPNGLDQLDAVEGGRRPTRVYLQEGPAKFISGLQSHDRHLFLFDDLLLVAKPTGKQRSQQRTYRLKHRVRLSELWLSENIEPLLIAALQSRSSCLAIGWPMTNNYVVQFSSVEEKELWMGRLSKYSVAQLKTVQPDSLSIRIINLTKSSNQLPVWMQVHCSEKARDVLGRAIENLGIAVSQANCQLWIKYAKDEAAVPLYGHEHPFAVQASHNRHLEGYIGEQKPMQLEFFIKRKTPAHQVEPKGFGQQRKTRTSRIMNWYSKKRGQGAGGREPRGKRKKYRMFGAPLGSVIVNGQLPEILQEMLIRLYTEGPQTLGIFRQSANHRKIKELKDAINNRQRVDLSSGEVSIHVVAALLKDMLRSVPGGILLSSRYTEFVATNDIKDTQTRVHHIQRILQKLPDENQVFLHYLIPLLHHIAQQEESNYMNSINLAICFAPSLLWPDSGLDVIKNEVPPLVQFMIEHSPEIFNGGLPELYVQASLSTTPGAEYNIPRPESYRVPTKKNDGGVRMYRHKRTNSMDTSTSEDSAGEEDLPSNLLSMQRSGLTVSDSQISVLSQQLEDDEYNTPLRSRNSEVPLGMGAESFQIPLSPKRPKKSRHPPERSSSYRGPNERPAYVQKYRVKQDDASRRKSIATQTTLQQSKPSFSPPLEPIPPSPNTSASSSSHSQDVSPFMKTRQMQSFDENEEFIQDEDDEPMEMGRPIQKRKRDKFFHSYSHDQETKPTRTHKASYYDHLSPLSPTEPASRSRSRSMNTSLKLGRGSSSFDTPMEEEMSGSWIQSPLAPSVPPLHPSHLPPVDSGKPPPIPPHASNQSITSRSSTSSGGHYYHTPPQMPQSRPSNLSLVSSVSESSMGSVPNKDSLESERSSLNREMIKSEISKRFNIPSRGNSFTGSSSTYSSGAGKHEYSMQQNGRSDSFNQELDNLQRKFQERRRPDGRQRVSSTNNSGVEAMGVTSPHSFDDRPESEQHLNSLPRPTTVEFIHPPPQVIKVASFTAPPEEPEEKPEHDPNKLFPEYNSDTESSPSRTLTRPDKINEVATNSLSKRELPSRYRSGYPAMRQHVRVGHAVLGVPRKHAEQAHAKKASSMPAEAEGERSKPEVELKAALSTPKPQASESTAIEKGKTPEISNVRPKSAEGVNRGTVEKFEPRQRTMSDVEMAKMKLGLIAPRRRSRSISDSKPTKMIFSDTEEKEEGEAVSRTVPGPSPEHGRADKRGMWLSHAPSSSDRKEAWVQRVKGGAIQEPSRNAVPGALPALQRTATAPEMSSKRRAATMPEYLVTRTAGVGRPGRMLGRGLVRTVKITAYDIPEPRKIHRINLRTYH